MPWPADTLRRLCHRVVLLIAVVAVGLPSSAQTGTVSIAFEQLTIEDGLSQGMISDILQDRQGFMWFATKDGLNRYDGYSFRVFRHDEDDSTSLVSSHVLSLKEDHNGLLWVGTSEGMDVFDPHTETFHHITIPELGSGNRAIFKIALDPRGRIWIHSVAGMLVIDPPSGVIGSEPIMAHRAPLPSDLEGLTIDSKGMLRAWYPTSLVSVAYDTRRDDHHLDTIRYTPTSSLRHVQDNGLMARSLLTCEDTLRHRIFGIHVNGILRFQGDTAGLPINAGSFSLGTPKSAVVETSGLIWAGTPDGMWRADPDGSWISRVVPQDPGQMKMIASTSLIYRDRGGVLWVGTKGYGILRYDPRVERFHHDPCGSIRWMAPTIDGRVVLWTDSAYLYDPHTFRVGEQTLLGTDATGSKLYMNDLSPCIVQDAAGYFWSNLRGILRQDEIRHTRWNYPQGMDSLRYRHPADLAFPLFLDADSFLYFGAYGNFVRLNRRTSRIDEYPYPIPKAIGTYTSLLHVIHRGENDTFWLGTENGLFRLDLRTKTWAAPVDRPDRSPVWLDKAIFCLLDDPADPDNILWVGTNGGGLYRLNKHTGAHTRYGLAEGLPNEVVYGLLADDDGLLWMSTNKGISRFDPATKEFRNYDASDGLQGNEFNRYAYCKLPDGTFIFGGVNGLNQFNPRELRDDPQPVQMAITDIKVMNKAVAFGKENALLRSPANLAHEIAIPYSEAAMLSIGFASMEYSGINSRAYRYQLEGFDPDPIQAGLAHSANYTNLSPGEYTFKVWGRNRDDVWNQAPTTLLVRILPPWYMTRWARALFALALLGLILLYLRLRTRSLRRQRDQLERTVEERTAEMRVAKERAELSERVKQQFLANMSHEIRTPMHAIVGMNNALRRRTHLPEQEPYLDAMAQSSANLLGLVNHILDLSKIEAGRLEPEKLPMEPRAVLAAVVEVMRYRVEEKELILDTAVSEAVPKVLIGDPHRLNQVLMNLVGNAIKFTEKGSIRVAMDAKILESNAVMLRCAVSDTGIGIEPDSLQDIFSEFSQADNSHTRKYGGSGLGLTISKHMVKMQGGTIDVESTPGKGSTFTFAIPYALPPDSSPPVVGSTTAIVDQKLREDLHILLVEDHEFNVMVAKDELTDAIPGVRIAVARNGKEAVAMAKEQAYDLILMDVQMPEMDGYEATRIIRAFEGEGAHVPIVGVTANVMRAELERCVEAGMDGYVTKPFEREMLLEAMAKALGRNI